MAKSITDARNEMHEWLKDAAALHHLQIHDKMLEKAFKLSIKRATDAAETYIEAVKADTSSKDD